MNPRVLRYSEREDFHSYLSGEASQKLLDLAALYHAEFPNDPPLNLNDASLERGGVFDLHLDWTPHPNEPKPVGHEEHRRGITIDIQANGSPTAIPARNYPAFINLIKKLHMTWYTDDLYNAGHFHVRLLEISQ